MHEKSCSLYIHWPFCPYRCSYCPFIALAGQNEYMQEYHEALILELKQWAKKHPNQTIRTIYFGGGTPSTYPDDLLLDMSGTLKDVFDMSALEEVTIEVNPGTVQPGQLLAWQKAGITRISIGVQTLHDDLLRSLNRHHTCADVIYLLAHANSFFDNISVDLMLGLPGMTMEQWQTDLKAVVSWPIQHVSLYSLQLHEATPLYYKVLQNKVLLPPDDLVADCYSWSLGFLALHGFCQYEVSNFAREGHESKHNNVYWQRLAYKGIGLSACSFDGNRRTQNENNLMNYLQKVRQGQDPITMQEILSPETIRIEKIMLGLRRTRGISRDIIFEGLAENHQKRLAAKIDSFIQQGFIHEKDNRLMLTNAGFVLENAIIAELV